MRRVHCAHIACGVATPGGGSLPRLGVDGTCRDCPSVRSDWNVRRPLGSRRRRATWERCAGRRERHRVLRRVGRHETVGYGRPWRWHADVVLIPDKHPCLNGGAGRTRERCRLLWAPRHPTGLSSLSAKWGYLS